LPKGESRVVDLASLPQGPLRALRDRLAAAGVALVLIRVESIAPVSTYWAVILDPASHFACSRVNMGHGSHLDPTIAATRAITEAAQSRLTFIHGAREDLAEDSYVPTPAHERLAAFFGSRKADLAFPATDRSTGDLAEDLRRVLAGLAAAGFDRVYRVELTQKRFGIPVAKVVAPGLGYIDSFLARHHDM
jgi:ribosomal protein S12 methylthiotransferase accessory factor